MKNIIITNKQCHVLYEEYGNNLYQYQSDIDEICNDIIKNIKIGNTKFITRVRGDIEKKVADWKVEVTTELTPSTVHISGVINFDVWSIVSTINLHIQYTEDSLKNGSLLRKLKTTIFHELTHSSDKKQAIKGWNNDDDIELANYDFDYENNDKIINGELSKPIQDILYMLFTFTELNAYSTEIYQDALINIPFKETETYNEIYKPLQNNLEYVKNNISQDELITLKNFFATKRYCRTNSTQYFDKMSLNYFHKWLIREITERLDKFTYKMHKAYYKGYVDKQQKNINENNENEFNHPIIGNDEWSPIYRVGQITHDEKGWGFFFSFELDYFDYSDTGYKRINAKKYYLNMNSKIWDPINELNLDVNTWSDIRGTAEIFDKYDIEYEQLDDDGFDCMTTTDDLATAGKHLGYQAVIFREIPQTQRPYNKNEDYGFDEICIFDTSIIKNEK